MIISRRAISGLFYDVDLRRTLEYQEASEAAETEIPFEEHLTAEQIVERNAAWRAHAEAVHAQLQAGMASLDKKVEDWLRFAAGLVTALVAVTFAAQTRLTCWFLAAVAVWFVAAVVFAAMRRGLAVPGLPNAQKVRDRIFYPDSYDRWMAAVIHLMSVQLRLLGDLRAEQLNLGIVVMLAGLVFLALHCVELYCAMVN